MFAELSLTTPESFIKYFTYLCISVVKIELINL